MNSIPRRRRPAWKILGAFLAAVALVTTALALWVRAVADRRWAAMERDLRAQLAEIASPARPVLRGDPLPGLAWDEYLPALNSLGEILWYKAGWKDIQGFPEGKAGADRAQVEAMIETHRVAIDALRRGAWRQLGAYPYRWEDGTSMKSPCLMQVSGLGLLAICEARILAEKGKGPQAAELLLDLAQFSRDLAQDAPISTQRLAMSTCGTALEELRTLVRSDRLTRQDLLEVERELVVLEGAFPEAVPFEPIDAMNLGFEFLETRNLYADLRQGMCMCLDDHGATPWMAWRYFFSDRLVAVDAFSKAVEHSKRASAVRAGSWNEVRRVYEEISERVSNDRNPLNRGHRISRLMGGHSDTRERRTQIRMLRVAARYRATGENLALEDPFGAKLIHERNDTRLKLWSVGRDGVDQGGVGDWKPSTGKDIVLEVDR